MTAAQEWAESLASWAIPANILDQAPESPWIHPPAMFTVPDVITDTPSHLRAREVMPSSVLDVGCGGGIAAFALTPPAQHVIGVDHQQAMLDMFEANAQERGVEATTVFGDWPEAAQRTPHADVVVCHHVAFNVPGIAAFLISLSEHAGKRVVLELPVTHPLSSLTPAWEHFWALGRPSEPTAQLLLEVARECGFSANIKEWASPLGRPQPFEDQVRHLRIRLCLPAERDEEIAEFLRAHPAPTQRELATIWWDI